MNRFLEMNRTLGEMERRRSRGEGRPRNGESASLPGGSGGLASPLSAAERALVVLLENGGVDLGIGRLVDLVLDGVPGSSLIPRTAREALVRAVEKKVREVTDDLLENAELALNRYAAARPEHYGEVVVLRNSTALHANLRDTLERLTQQGKIIDLFVLTHGSTDSIALAGGTSVSGADIRNIRVHNGNRPIRLRSVYMMSCVGSSLNRDWLAIGAKASSGAIRNNYLPEPTMFFFFQNWKKGQSFSDAVTNAYRSSIATMKAILREAAERLVPLPAGLAGAVAERLADLENRDFVKDSAPVIDGDASVTIGSDALSFATAIRPSVAYTILPLGRAMTAVARTRSWTISPAGIDFIKSFEGFRSRLYDDPAGHCTVGYGTLVHRGRCSGDASEAPYLAGITEEQAVGLLRGRLADFERAVNDRVTTELSQHQYDALVSFAYNVGTTAFAGSTLLSKLNGGDYGAVPVELRKWVLAGGRQLPGLVRRRDAEARMFTAGDYSTGKSWTGSLEQPRGIRNNNPGNIRLSGESWEGKVPNTRNTDGAFEQFTSFAHGVRALVLLLRNYIRSGRDTVRAVIHAYAPASDGNATDRYVAFVEDRFRRGGLVADAGTRLLADRRTLRLLAQAIARMENGVECISDAQFDEGFDLLPEDVRKTIGLSAAFLPDLYAGLGEAARVQLS